MKYSIYCKLTLKPLKMNINKQTVHTMFNYLILMAKKNTIFLFIFFILHSIIFSRKFRILCKSMPCRNSRMLFFLKHDMSFYAYLNAIRSMLTLCFRNWKTFHLGNEQQSQLLYKLQWSLSSVHLHSIAPLYFRRHLERQTAKMVGW